MTRQKISKLSLSISLNMPSNEFCIKKKEQTHNSARILYTPYIRDRKREYIYALI